MNIFLTGATGFVGGAIARELKGKHRITALARSATSAGVAWGCRARPASATRDWQPQKRICSPLRPNT